MSELPPPEMAHGTPRAGRPRSVVPTIGRGRGALIVHCGPEAVGVRVTLAGPGGMPRRSREVRPARLCDRPIVAAVFDDLPKGVYTLWAHDRVQRREITIYGNHTTQLDLALEAGALPGPPPMAYESGHHPVL